MDDLGREHPDYVSAELRAWLDRVSPDALRRAFAGPDFPPGVVKRRYLVIVDGMPRELREPDDTEDPDPGCECE